MLRWPSVFRSTGTASFGLRGRSLFGGTANGLTQYKDEYQQSIADPHRYWGDVGRSSLRWDVPFHSTFAGVTLLGFPCFFPRVFTFFVSSRQGVWAMT